MRFSTGNFEFSTGNNRGERYYFSSGRGSSRRRLYFGSGMGPGSVTVWPYLAISSMYISKSSWNLRSEGVDVGCFGSSERVCRSFASSAILAICWIRFIRI